MPPSPPQPAAFPVSALVEWYDKNCRTLPWRQFEGAENGKDFAANPYHVLVSEAMLQQTQVATALPYFERFVKRFPTVEPLAAADEQTVLSLWQGLGYYRRARNLHQAAKRIVADFAGQVPATVEELLVLPGVGRYTAGAVASIAYNQPAPIVDGNVARVLSRFYGLTAPIDQPAGLRPLWSLAEALVQASQRPAAFNQSLMELGALVCTPKAAKCLYCPLRESCTAFVRGQVETLPVKSPKRKPTAVTHTVLAITRGGKFLFEQRPETGLWASMWQLVTFDDPLCVSLSTAAQQRLGLSVSEPRPLMEFTHQTTHRTMRFEVFCVRVLAGRCRGKQKQWRRLDDLVDLPLAKPQQTIIARLREIS